MAEQRSAGASRGAEALHNEDRFVVEDRLGLYLVCDGQSNRPAGERAAAIAADSVEHFLERHLESIDDSGRTGDGRNTLQTVEAAIEYALSSVLDAAQENAELEGMASTVTLLIIQRDRGYIGHVGDSRAYLVRRGKCSQLTADQEWAESDHEVGEFAASDSPRSGATNESTRPVETFSLELHSGDTFVLCTDGAEAEMEDRDFVRSIETASPVMIASRLVSRASRERPGHDATCVVFRVPNEHESAWVTASGEPEWLDGVRTVAHGTSPDNASEDGHDRDKPRFNPTYGGQRRRAPSSGPEEEAPGRRSGIEFA